MQTQQSFVSEVEKGEFIGGHQVLDVLGRGSTGTTYQVINNAQSKEFALKTLYLSDTIQPDWIDRLEAQSALLQRTISPFIDPIIRTGRSEGYWFCIKDFVHDGDGNSYNLKTFLERHQGALSHYQVYHIIRQILTALHHCHSYRDEYNKHLIHGNLKPENILISQGSSQSLHFPYEIKLTDLQPFSLMSHEIMLNSYLHWKKTIKQFPLLVSEEATTQALCSIYRSYDYQSPERSQTGRGSIQDDLFAVGVIAYQLLTGSLPTGVFPLPHEAREEIPSQWDQIIRQSLQSCSEARYLSAKAMLEELDQFFRGEDEEEVQVEAPPQSRERYSITPKGMLYVPAGSFVIGSSDCGEDALPQHESSSPGFYMDRTPITNAQFSRFVIETEYVTDAEKEGGGPIWIDGEWRIIPGISWKHPHENKLPPNFQNHPVVQVTHNDAIAYCKWAGNRLPTEEEWEYAARGGQKDIKYPWGNTLSKMHANYGSNSTSEVMKYHANGFGLFDMAGNVWEWTASWYQAYPGNNSTSSHFGEKYRVVRGGCWMYDGSQANVSYRNANQPGHNYPTIGFRTVRDFKPV